MSQSEEESHRLGPGVVGSQFSGDVVDGSDVVDIKSMPQTQHVSAHPETDREHLRTDGIVLRRDQEYQKTESDDVQHNDRAEDRENLDEVSPGPGTDTVHGHVTSP